MILPMAPKKSSWRFAPPFSHRPEPAPRVSGEGFFGRKPPLSPRWLLKIPKSGEIRLEEEFDVSTTLYAALAAVALLGFTDGVAGGADAQTADPAFAAFNETCMAADANPDAVSGVAKTHGWTAANAAGQTLPGFSESGKVSKTKKIGDTEISLFSWKGAKGPVFAEECQIHATRGDLATLQGATAKALGMAAAQTTPTKVVFHYRGPAGAPTALTDNSQFDAAAGTGGLYILTLSSDGKGVNADLLKIHK